LGSQQGQVVHGMSVMVEAVESDDATESERDMLAIETVWNSLGFF
jgi:hypothetical protein